MPDTDQDRSGNMVAQYIMGCFALLIGLGFVVFCLIILAQFYEEYIRPVFVQ
jgi:hypothetical protein